MAAFFLPIYIFKAEVNPFTKLLIKIKILLNFLDKKYESETNKIYLSV